MTESFWLKDMIVLGQGAPNQIGKIGGQQGRCLCLWSDKTGFVRVYHVPYGYVHDRDILMGKRIWELVDLDECIQHNNDKNNGNIFINEVLNCTVLKYHHPNVMQLLACGLDVRELEQDKSKKGVLIFPFINGGDLDTFIKSGKLKQHLELTCQNEKAKQLAMMQLCLQIGEGIEFLHSQNLNHCDLKPQNILM